MVIKRAGSLARHLAKRSRGERRREHRGGRRSTDGGPKRGWIPTAALALGVALLDWTTKYLVARSVPRGGFEVVWSDRVALWHLRNDAMILGLYGSFPLGVRKVIALLCALVAVILLFEVVGRGHRLPGRQRALMWLFTGLAFGGMLGNLGERAVHWGVTDFLSFRWGDFWLPPGNFADLALFLSIPLSFVVIGYEMRARGRREEARAAEPVAALGEPS